MLTILEVTSAQGETLMLPFQYTIDGYLIKDITGIDPVKATIVSSGYADLDGEKLQSVKREKRNIVLTLDLTSDYVNNTIRQLRTNLYGFFMPKANVKLTFSSDDFPPVSIDGVVESFDSPPITKDPTATISILCMNPDFYSATSTTISQNTTQTGEAFFENYEGTVETGALIRMYIDRPENWVTIYNTVPEGMPQVMDIQTPLVAGDIVEISTVVGNKYANVIRNDNATSILYGVSPYADWLRFFPGRNAYTIYSKGAPYPYTIEYFNKYGGL